ncbi:hypothetical protein G8759_11020 [Spirosoma aureum]|uniref:T9SS type A sorting domain-containing protein n=1 Tax=Spirosoma aureum TaxID=2692134 RepID=A0A6G9AL06_9BACT|nr:hypothetical protein [Spirosoma aureum]QIP13118.1 hypothetical protein G8759_11020 [Spirosoma aureum]
MKNKYEALTSCRELVMLILSLILAMPFMGFAQGPLRMTAPSYNCQTGAITFNTADGDGSLITYSAPGITRASVTDNFGIVEQGLRNDPKLITIMATQSGHTATYIFNFAAYCASPLLPVPVWSIIPDRTFTVGQTITAYPDFQIGSGFYQEGEPYNYLTWPISATGLPPGMSLSSGLLSRTAFYVGIGGSPATAGTYPVTVTAINPRVPNDPPFTTSFTITIINPSGSSLALLAPTYNCTTGAIAFNTSGGDGSPITYSAPGISRVSATDNFGIVEQGLRNDPKPITILATQSGKTVSYTFDLSVYLASNCNSPQPPTGDGLSLLAPTYDCATGAITFKTSGGNGSLIEFKAVGITDWTTNPAQFVDKDSRTANDVQPFTLMARQSGQTVTYTWDLKATCGRARAGVPETSANLSLSLMGNPVQKQVRVLIEGAQGQPVKLWLSDLTGRLLESRQIESAGVYEEQLFRLDQQTPGLLLLKAATNQQVRTVKIIRQ